MSIQSSYLDNVFSPAQLKYTVKACVSTLHKFKVQFEAVAFRGMSGAIVAPMVAVKMNKPLILIRKPGDGSHSSYRVEGYTIPCKYIIVDDFISSGRTIEAIHQAINEKSLEPFTCVAVLAYRRQRDQKKTWFQTDEEKVVKEKLGEQAVYLGAFTEHTRRIMENLA